MKEGKTLTTERKRAFIVNCMFFACLVAIAYIAFKYLLAWMLPFVIGLIAAACLQPPINWICKKTKLKKKLISPILAFILVSVVACFVVMGTYNAIGELGDLISRLPSWYKNSAPVVSEAINTQFESLLANLPDEVEQQVISISNDLIQYIQSKLISFSSTALSWVANKASQLPSLLISIIITVVATFFMSVEFDNIKKFIKLQIPEKYRVLVLNSWETFGRTVVRMLTSYLFIMFCTFCELALGLTFLQVNYSVLIAALISVVDILPVLGTGTILIPWGLICLLIGRTGLGAGILALYVLITIIRNILEPKIIGNRIGLHPLVTLVFMYLGLHIMGIFGMFLFPLTLILIKELQDRGLIKIWNS